MKKYDVTLTGHFEKTVSIYADSPEQAAEKLRIILFDTDLITFSDEDFVCGEADIFIKTGLSEEQLFVSMAKEVSAAVFDFKHKESRDASDFKSFCVAYMVSSRYGVDTKGFRFEKLPKEFAGMETQEFKGQLGRMRDVLGEIQSDMYKSLEKNKPPKSKEQER